MFSYKAYQYYISKSVLGGVYNLKNPFNWKLNLFFISPQTKFEGVYMSHYMVDWSVVDMCQNLGGANFHSVRWNTIKTTHD